MVVGLIPNNGVCEVLRQSDDWYVIRSGSVSGYVMSKYVTLNKGVAEAASVKKIRAQSSFPIYSQKSESSKVWDTAITGNTYNVTDDSGDWITIDYDGAVGYVKSDVSVIYFMGAEEAQPVADLTGVSEQRRTVVKYAMQYLGNSYVWGGNDPNTGADCSGFVRYVLKHVAGVQLPRVSYEQCNVGTRVTSMSMKPGDLIFYANNAGTVGHVAMYIGNGTIIHAASTKSGIRLSQWNYRTPKYIRSVLD